MIIIAFPFSEKACHSDHKVLIGDTPRCGLCVCRGGDRTAHGLLPVGRYISASLPSLEVISLSWLLLAMIMLLVWLFVVVVCYVLFDNLSFLVILTFLVTDFIYLCIE